MTGTWAHLKSRGRGVSSGDRGVGQPTGRAELRVLVDKCRHLSSGMKMKMSMNMKIKLKMQTEEEEEEEEQQQQQQEEEEEENKSSESTCDASRA